MIIGYYPGAGGNRCYQNLIGKQYTIPGIAYDSLTGNIEIRGQYFDNISMPQILTKQNMLLHCVNSQRIRQVVPHAAPLIIIKSDLKKSLRREWSIKGKFKPMFQENIQTYEFLMLDLYQAVRAEQWPIISSITEFNSLPKEIRDECVERLKSSQSMADCNSIYNFLNAAYTAIGWHLELYKQWPIETSLADQVIDIDNDDSEFAEFMRGELDLYNNPLFDFAWSVYQEYGADEPINSLYEQKFVQQ